MRAVFMGSPDYAATILRGLASRHEVVGVYTNADKVRSRGSRTEPTPVKAAALELGLPVFCPRTLRDPEEQDALAALAPDVICVAAYGKILPREVLEIPAFGCINVHASVLPRWRGAAPIQRAILAGDAVQGVSIMRMGEGLDTGDFACVRTIDASGVGAADVTAKLAELGVEALLEVLAQFPDGVQWQEQDDALATYARKIDKGELNLNFEDSAEMALRKVLASDGEHPAKCLVGNRSITVIRAALSDNELPLGSAKLVDGALELGFRRGSLRLEQVKPDGKALMSGSAFAAGVQGMKAGVTWAPLA
ncbi:MAG: methionyl-tRNA formyltransferase [Eggerthellaceae bacterium]|nr:methionyl-tRNA formyltransferase [Eggerthellaceae bacterium]